MEIPSAEQQITFLGNIQRVLTEGNFVSTYKYALLLALADLSIETGDDTGDPLRVTTKQIAAKWIDFYWPQCAPYPTSAEQTVLRQNTGAPAAILRALTAEVQAFEGKLFELKRRPDRWKALVRDVDQTVRTMPLWRVQRVGKETLEFLYPNARKGSEITLNPGVAFCFRKHYSLITELVRGAWVRYVRRFNPDIFGVTADLHEFMFGTGRASLKDVYEVLCQIDGSKCFYCNRGVVCGEQNVDHFIPWSRYPVDLGHNFVLADKGCNAAKSDVLPALQHFRKWMDRNASAESVLAPAFMARRLPHNLQTSRRVALWAYNQTASNNGLTWVRGREYEHLPGGWQSSMFGADFAGVPPRP